MRVSSSGDASRSMATIRVRGTMISFTTRSANSRTLLSSSSLTSSRTPFAGPHLDQVLDLLAGDRRRGSGGPTAEQAHEPRGGPGGGGGERPQQPGEDADHRDGGERQVDRAPLGQRLGHDLAEEEHHDGGEDRGQGHRGPLGPAGVASHQVGGHRGRQGADADVGEGVADEQGGEDPLRLLDPDGEEAGARGPRSRAAAGRGPRPGRSGRSRWPRRRPSRPGRPAPATTSSSRRRSRLRPPEMTMPAPGPGRAPAI